MKIVKKILLLIIIAFLVVCCIVGIQGYTLYHEAIQKTPLSTMVEEKRSDSHYVTIENLPTYYKNAVVSVEDRRFYEHSAIDIRSIGRAIITNIKEWDLVEGGSTITQQLAKNLYFTQKQQASRKVAEIIMAFQLEDHYSKDEILELYVNTSYFGDGYYGIREASLGYYGKEPKDLSLEEATLLAGVPNAPSVYAPTKNLSLAKKRQAHVIKSMVTNGYLSQEEANQLLKEE